jgi:hypothetical protein
VLAGLETEYLKYRLCDSWLPACVELLQKVGREGFGGIHR